MANNNQSCKKTKGCCYLENEERNTGRGCAQPKAQCAGGSKKESCNQNENLTCGSQRPSCPCEKLNSCKARSEKPPCARQAQKQSCGYTPPSPCPCKQQNVKPCGKPIPDTTCKKQTRSDQCACKKPPSPKCGCGMQEQQNPCSQKKSKPCGAEQTDEMPCCGFSNAAPECTLSEDEEPAETVCSCEHQISTCRRATQTEPVTICSNEDLESMDCDEKANDCPCSECQKPKRPKEKCNICEPPQERNPCSVKNNQCPCSQPARTKPKTCEVAPPCPVKKTTCVCGKPLKPQCEIEKPKCPVRPQKNPCDNPCQRTQETETYPDSDNQESSQNNDTNNTSSSTNKPNLEGLKNATLDPITRRLYITDCPCCKDFNSSSTKSTNNDDDRSKSISGPVSNVCSQSSESENDEPCKRNQCPMPDFDCSKFINEKCGAPDSVSKATETEENEKSPLQEPLETDKNEPTTVSKTSEETEPTQEEENKRASTASQRGSTASKRESNASNP